MFWGCWQVDRALEAGVPISAPLEGCTELVGTQRVYLYILLSFFILSTNTLRIRKHAKPAAQFLSLKGNK